MRTDVSPEIAFFFIRRILGVETLAEPGEEPRVERRKGERRNPRPVPPVWVRDLYGRRQSDRRKAGA